ncbi:dihydroflavonol-4-reductase [Kitasatospora sp. NE20-6]|uniref:SDR family oxidoreductase n=1 Tax=Kitasatospora sp. NE20-6 TaxID=2859066 RepID=UPI0034DC2292
MPTSEQRVLVTGGSGFIAGHCILRLLEQGHFVRTTVRSPEREPAVRAALADAGMTRGERLEFVAADLMSDTGWVDAVSGCDAVLHVASPVHIGRVRNEQDVIGPAREGTLRVLRAARDAGVRRTVLTSAFHAVGFGHGHTDRTFTEDDWSVLDGPGMDAYGRSKTLAERDAWDFMTAQGGSMELVALLPVAVMGPVLGTQVSGANHIVQRSLNGDMPGYPNMWVPVVDVRDVALAHVTAMTSPAAAGRRILLPGGPALSMHRIGSILRSHLGDAAHRVPTRTVPDVLVRLAALFSAEFRPVAADLNHVKKVSDDRARRVLGWQPGSPEEAVVSSARSMLDKNLVKN